MLIRPSFLAIIWGKIQGCSQKRDVQEVDEKRNVREVAWIPKKYKRLLSLFGCVFYLIRKYGLLLTKRKFM